MLISVIGSLQSSTREKIGTFLLSLSLHILHYGPGMSSKVKHQALLQEVWKTYEETPLIKLCNWEKSASTRPFLTHSLKVSFINFTTTFIFFTKSKSDSHLPKKNFICFNESRLKMLKNAFYFIWKALFVLKIFTFLPWHFGHVEATAWLER